eukprot:TRINITY_DN2545_c0_g1_i3.p1 TRINITY_DN2545_c0_g1~~TRINITY_DN2545_c0_g1_i3.p1  ORF type:complete len:262 (-),score=-0.82 TRINITY_DN2545_c0_g1_i3:1566-2351(-)
MKNKLSPLIAAVAKNRIPFTNVKLFRYMKLTAKQLLSCSDNITAMYVDFLKKEGCMETLQTDPGSASAQLFKKIYLQKYYYIIVKLPDSIKQKKLVCKQAPISQKKQTNIQFVLYFNNICQFVRKQFTDFLQIFIPYTLYTISYVYNIQFQDVAQNKLTTTRLCNYRGQKQFVIIKYSLSQINQKFMLLALNYVFLAANIVTQRAYQQKKCGVIRGIVNSVIQYNKSSCHKKYTITACFQNQYPYQMQIILYKLSKKSSNT